MATLLSRATGNWLTAGTWELINSTSFNNTETTTTALTTSYQASSTFTPGAITISGIMVKLSVRTGTTGTMSVDLAIAGVQVTGSEVTINTADLPAAATANLNGGWVFFKFATPILLLAATAYAVRAKTSSASQVSLFATATTNWARALVTTTTQAPTTGDDVVVGGEYLSAGSNNAFTVTMNETASTDYGAAATSLVTPTVAVCSKGILRSGVASSTNYQLKLSGNLIIYSGGEFDMGTVGAEMPRNSSCVLTFDCGTNVTFGLVVRNLGTLVTQGLSRSSSKNIFYCKLNTDEAVNSTSLGVDTDTGWLDNDDIGVGSTTRTYTQCEQGTLNGNANTSDLTVDGFAGAGGGLANAHSGTSPTQAEVILLTRNVRIQGASASLQTYIDIKATAIVDCDWTEFKWFGSNTANKRGIDCAVTTGSVNIQYCSLRNFEVSNSLGFNYSATSGNGFVFSNNVTFRVRNTVLTIVATSASWTVDNNILMYNFDGGSAVMAQISDVGGVFTNNTIVGCGATTTSVNYGEREASINSFSNLTIHSGAGQGMNFTGGYGSVVDFSAWRNSAHGLNIQTIIDTTFDGLILFGNTTRNIAFGACGGRMVIIDPVLNGDTTFSTTSGIDFNSNVASTPDITIFNGDFGSASGIKTAHTNDFNFVVGGSTAVSFRIMLINTKLASSTEVVGHNDDSVTNNSFLSSQKHDQTTGLHKTWKKFGIITIEGTTVQAGAKSMKLTPNNASNKLESSGAFGGFKVAVASGQTVTPAVYVYEDGSYNGARARLIVKRNDAMGINADTVLDTATAASDGAWEQLTGTTASVTDDGTLEFVIDCDGTAGNLFVDSFTVS